MITWITLWERKSGGWDKTPKVSEMNWECWCWMKVGLDGTYRLFFGWVQTEDETSFNGHSTQSQNDQDDQQRLDLILPLSVAGFGRQRRGSRGAVHHKHRRIRNFTWSHVHTVSGHFTDDNCTSREVQQDPLQHNESKTHCQSKR